jgi:hypothetical protein
LGGAITPPNGCGGRIWTAQSTCSQRPAEGGRGCRWQTTATHELAAFETDAHPPLARSVKLALRTRDIECLDYITSANPPILHWKETFLHPDHPMPGQGVVARGG